MNIELGDYVETVEGYVREVVSIDGGYVCVRASYGDIWITKNNIVKIRQKHDCNN